MIKADLVKMMHCLDYLSLTVAMRFTGAAFKQYLETATDAKCSCISSKGYMEREHVMSPKGVMLAPLWFLGPIQGAVSHL